MGLMVDPNKDAGDGGVGPGRKLAAAVGFRRWTAAKGTPMMTMGFVVLRDGAKSGDEGKVFMERFAITQAAIFRIAGWAQATGWTEPFDAENDDHIQRIMAKGAVVAELKMDTYNGKERTEVDKFDPYKGDHDPSWDAMTTKGEQEFNDIQRKMQEKRSSGGYNSGGGAGYSNSEPAPAAHPDDSIPF